MGQTGWAMATAVGNTVAKSLPLNCCSTGLAKVFWPVASNLMRAQGMMVFNFQISQKQWQSASDVAVYLSFAHQNPLVMHLK